jgi:DNA-binding CsgD family transcriptional regulator
MAQELGLPDVLSDALNTEAFIEYGEGGDWEGMVQRALSIALTAGKAEQAGRAYANLCEYYREERRFGDVDRVYREGAAYCEEHDIPTYLICLQGRYAESLAQRGTWDESAELCRAMLRGQASPINRFVFCTALAMIHARRGDEGAWPLLDEALEVAIGSDEPERIAVARLSRAEAHWLAGQEQELHHELELSAEFAANYDPWTRGWYGAWVLRAHADLPAASGTVPLPYELMFSGDHRGSAAAWDELGCPYEAAQSLLDSGEEDAMREALRRLDALGATAAVQAARREMRRVGVRSIPAGVRAATRANPHGLTNREREVLELVSDGRTNAEIAEQLFIAAKTVDHHVSAVLGKLGVASRGEAAKAAVRLGMSPPQLTG